MPRIRTIKPEFWTSAQVLECSTNARLLFIGLWNFADDAGRHPDSAKQIKAEVFPADDFDLQTVQGMIDELSRNGLLTRYVVDGKRFLAITGWHHQRIDKPQPPKYPGPEEGHSENVPRTLPPEGIGKEGIGKERREGAEQIAVAADAAPSPPPVATQGPNRKKRGTLGHFVPEDWTVSLDDYQWAIGQGYTPEFLKRETERFCDHEFAKPRSDWARAWRNWITRDPPRRTGNGSTYRAA